jgi:hypothetical protein
MTPRPRPSFASESQRPLSAIYLCSSPNNIPDLPEPPSPGAASSSENGSGLPSPPATNSTGSGSTGDIGSIRKRPASYQPSTTSNSNSTNSPTNTTMLNGHDKLFHAAFQRSQKGPDDDDEDGNENDDAEDNTAKLADGGRRHSFKSPSENILALQRLKSLAQRNRMVRPLISQLMHLILIFCSTAPFHVFQYACMFPPASSTTQPFTLLVLPYKSHGSK